MADTVQQINLRAEHVDRIVKGFALQEYKFKQVCMINSSDSWQESYYQENPAELTGGTGSAVRGIPRLAQFPNLEPNWTKTSSYIEKYGGQGIVSYEDEKTNAIDVIARTMIRISRAVAKAVDDQIWAVISESQSASNINSVTISAGNEWDSATVANRDPIYNILNAVQKIVENNYGREDLHLLLSPKDMANLMRNDKVSQNPQFRAQDVVQNGVVGSILGLKIIESPSVTADYALVIKGQMAATWKSVVGLTTETINDPGRMKTIRAWELGVTQLVNPKAVTLISNTQA